MENSRYQWEKTAGLDYEDSQVESFLKLAGEMGLSDEQLSMINRWDNERYQTTMSDYAMLIADQQEQLRKEWGINFENNVSQALKVVDMLDKSFPGFREELEKTRIGNNIQVIRAFAMIAGLLSEDSLGAGANPANGGPMPGEMGMLNFPSMQQK